MAPDVDVRDLDYGGCDYENQFETRPCFGPPCSGTDSHACFNRVWQIETSRCICTIHMKEKISVINETKQDEILLKPKV